MILGISVIELPAQERSEPCMEFTLMEFSNESLVVKQVGDQIQQIFREQLPTNKANIQVRLCKNEIRSYTDEQIVILTYLACIYFELANFDKASILLEEVLLFGEQTNNWRAVTMAHNRLGLIAHINNFKISAFFHQQKLLEISERNNDRMSKVSAYLGLGASNFSSGNYKAAEMNYQNCLDLLQPEDKGSTLGWVLLRMGELKGKLNQQKEALSYLEKAATFWEKTNNKKGACFTHLQFALLTKDNQPKKKLVYLEKSLKYAEASEYTLGIIEVLLNLGYFYIQQNRLEEALAVNNRILKISQQKEAIPRRMKAHKMLAKIYTLKGNMAQANIHHKAYQEQSQIYQKNQAESSSKSIENIENLILQKKQYELLQKEEAHTKERLYFQKMLSLFLIVGTLLAISLALTFYYKNKRNKEQKERLRGLNQKNRQQADDLTKAKIITENQKKDLEVQMVKKAIILSQQGEIIQSIAKQLDNMEENIGTRAIRNEVKKVKDNSLWTELNIQISKSNEQLFERLLEKYPTLTQSDLRLCAFLKMNMNTKEIANLTFKNPESVKVARSRLRKKLGLTHTNTTFTTFLNQMV